MTTWKNKEDGRKEYERKRGPQIDRHPIFRVYLPRKCVEEREHAKWWVGGCS